MTRAFKLWIASLALVALFTFISVTWLDRPIARLVNELFGSREVSSTIALSVPLMVAAAVFVIYGLLAFMGRQFSRLETSILMCDVSLLVNEVIKNQFKIVFGRTWPDSWAPGVLSYIHDRQFGFHFFRSGQSYESFPSGHAATVAAVMTVLWITYPRARLAYAICIAAADIGLILNNVHFLSDVVAGTFLGASVAMFTVSLWGTLPVRRPVIGRRSFTNPSARARGRQASGSN
jgi:membrane-associated phospholipid phosphatase